MRLLSHQTPPPPHLYSTLTEAETRPSLRPAEPCGHRVNIGPGTASSRDTCICRRRVAIHIDQPPSQDTWAGEALAFWPDLGSISDLRFK